MDIIEAISGESVYDVLNRGLALAKQLNKCVLIKHNNVSISVSPRSYINDLCTIYDLRQIIKKSMKEIR